MVRSPIALGSLPRPRGFFTQLRRHHLLLVALIVLPACSSRTLTIESTPPGARVILNREDVGRTPVTVPYRYGGTNEILVIPDAGGPEDTPYLPALLYHDTWKFALDFPVVDAFADLLGTEDHQVVAVTLQESETVKLLRKDDDTREEVLSAMRERADILRRRARELFIDAPPRQPLTPPRGPSK